VGRATRQFSYSGVSRESELQCSSSMANSHKVPGAPKKKRFSFFNAARKKRFLEEYAKTALVVQSAAIANISCAAVLAHRKSDPEFQANYDLAYTTYCESIEKEIHRRAIEGWDKPVWHKGEMVGTEIRHSDRLLELYAKRHIAAYRDKVDVSGHITGGVLVIAAPATDSRDWADRYGKAIVDVGDEPRNITPEPKEITREAMQCSASN